MRSEILEAFARLRRDRGSHVAVQGFSEHRALTFEALGSEADAVAADLRRARLPAGALVVTLIGNRTAFVSTFLACLECGVTIVPLDGDSAVPEALALLDRFQAPALIVRPGVTIERTHAELQLANGLTLVRLVGEAPEGKANASHYGRELGGVRRVGGVRRPGGAAEFDGVALFKVTSGSTSAPKAVMATEANLLADGRHIVEAMGIGPEDVNIAAIPLSHSYGLGNLLMPLVLQGSAIVLRDAFAPTRLFDDIRQSNATVMPGVPFMFDYIRQHLAGGRFPPSMRVLITAGARLDPATLAAFKDCFGLKIHSFYGTSETGGIAYDSSDEVSDPVTMGRPLPGVEVRFRALGGAGPGEGRLHVRSEAVARGYAGDGDGTRESFLDGGYLTGDVGYADGDGRLFLTGRVSRFINVAGRKVHPEEVARVLRSYPGVSDAKVFGVPDLARGQALVACVVADPDRADAIAIRRHCSARLSAYKIPRQIVVLRTLPVDARGKTDQRALEELVKQAQG